MVWGHQINLTPEIDLRGLNLEVGSKLIKMNFLLTVASWGHGVLFLKCLSVLKSLLSLLRYSFWNFNESHSERRQIVNLIWQHLHSTSSKINASLRRYFLWNCLSQFSFFQGTRQQHLRRNWIEGLTRPRDFCLIDAEYGFVCLRARKFCTISGGLTAFGEGAFEKRPSSTGRGSLIRAFVRRIFSSTLCAQWREVPA